MRRANLGCYAKIVATLGPASSSVEIIASLIVAGMNVARINMSHGTYESHAALIENIREASRKTGLEVAILIDLQGPKIRVILLVGRSAANSMVASWVLSPSSARKTVAKTVKNIFPFMVFPQTFKLNNHC